MSVVVTHWSIKSFWYPAVTERYRWYDGRWHFNICLPSREWHQTGPLLVSISALCDTLELLLHCLKKVLLCDWTQAACVFLLLYPTRQIVAFPMFVFQEHWWSWSQLAVTMPATLTASSQCSCAHFRRWCGNTWAPSRPTQGSQKPARVHAWIWIQWENMRRRSHKRHTHIRHTLDK